MWLCTHQWHRSLACALILTLPYIDLNWWKMENTTKRECVRTSHTVLSWMRWCCYYYWCWCFFFVIGYTFCWLCTLFPFCITLFFNFSFRLTNEKCVIERIRGRDEKTVRTLPPPTPTAMIWSYCLIYTISNW